MGPPPSSTSVDDIDITTGPLKARFVAKGYSQYISDHIKETFAATPSSTSLTTLLLHAVLHQYQVTSCDISSAFFEYANRGGHLRPASSRGPPTSTSSHLEATSCRIWFAHITKDVAGTTSRTTTTTTEGRQVRMGEAKPHGFGLRRRPAHSRNIKGDIRHHCFWSNFDNHSA